MAISRKHYVALASVIRDVYGKYPEPNDVETRAAIRVIVSEMCRVFKSDNPNFDRERFIRASFGESAS